MPYHTPWLWQEEEDDRIRRVSDAQSDSTPTSSEATIHWMAMALRVFCNLGAVLGAIHPRGYPSSGPSSSGPFHDIFVVLWHMAHR